ncbi:hypothetical protein M2459_002936 [Parabacteroides sp. PF5-5]|uniref:glycosyltransferase family 1 protein n=1 Tax=unclassified Parabacteroides TaxID=2649774 RepID=UPI0024751BC6|nr:MULTISPECIES: glycosyltransferase family 1 protein [unclassified Parabacteroides]MDH6306222.1 hypothetical protein [Parabacteroides sp. PH5-39]MDH6317181.1 hypothetical protein [Parabacteroides sp. PF5-13]MDH6320934.1 hypothetical protein [Parabacteroides sp. PH5-13]MDH6324665.1 hypothetical protein [Parabacteroides sp. PH5-8]MDH6328284.1 hypothetical protein [Parabacteroides sp. PH5-41]
MDKHLHIIALNIPYPPNYGGIIDIYYKIKSLHAIGVKIILHCFEYERHPSPELELLCEKVYYYKRRTGWLTNISLLPYNVYSRKSPELLKNLLKDNYPILFEGLHSCYYLTDKRLRGRKKIYRESNIEHDYYQCLANSCKERIKRMFFRLEAWRFKRYQKVINDADLTLAVSMADVEYLRNEFPGKQVEFMTSFHENDEINIKPGASDFVLYHAKLSVEENEQAALYLIKQVFSKLNCTCVVAGMNPSIRIRNAISLYRNIKLEANPSQERMNELIREAHIHVLVTFQDTGLKLKLLNSLFAGRHILVNPLMLTGSGVDALCHIASTPEEMIAACDELLTLPFTPDEIQKRKDFLIPAYSNRYQAERLYRMIYE